MGWGNGQDGCMRLIASTTRCFLQSPVWGGGGRRGRMGCRQTAKDSFYFMRILGQKLSVNFVIN